MICLVFGPRKPVVPHRDLQGAKRAGADPVTGRSRHSCTDHALAPLGIQSMTDAISCFVIGSSPYGGRRSLAARPASRWLYLCSLRRPSAFSAFALFSPVAPEALLQTMGRNPTLTGRTEVWKAILPFAQNPIFGSGYESFWLGDRLVTIGQMINSPGIQEAHNGYLEIYLNLGWIGLAPSGADHRNGLPKGCRSHTASASEYGQTHAGLLRLGSDLQLYGGGVQNAESRMDFLPSGGNGYSKSHRFRRFGHPPGWSHQ